MCVIFQYVLFAIVQVQVAIFNDQSDSNKKFSVRMQIEHQHSCHKNV